MDYFFSWIKSIVIYLLLVSLVYQIFPDSQYKKYMRVSTGLILMLVAVWPLVTFSETDQSLSYYLDLESARIDAQDFEQINEAARQTQTNKITSAYKLQLEQKVLSLFDGTSMYPVETEISMIEDVEDDYYGSVQKVVVTVTDSLENVGNTTHTDNNDTSVVTVSNVEVPQISVNDVPEDHGVNAEINSAYQTEIEEIRQAIASALYVDVEDVYISVR